MDSLPPAQQDQPLSPSDIVFMAMAGDAGAARLLAAARDAQPPQGTAASLAGRVFHDRDGDGQPSEGDEGMEGVEIVLSGRTVQGREARLLARTDAEGGYRFDGLPPGAWAVHGPASAGRPVAGTVNGVKAGEARGQGIGRISLPPGAMAEGYSFAFVRPAALAGLVLLEDEDEDGPARLPMAGVMVLLSGVDGQGRSVQLATATDPRGAYRFEGLHPGVYDLYPAPGKGYAVREARPGDHGGRAVGGGKLAGVAVRSGSRVSGCVFALAGTGSLAGRIVSHARGGLIPAAGVRVALSGHDEAGRPVSHVVRTGSDGRYSFASLRPGTYRVEASPPGSARFWSASPGSAGGQAVAGPAVEGVRLGGGAAAGRYDFESRQPGGA